LALAEVRGSGFEAGDVLLAADVLLAGDFPVEVAGRSDVAGDVPVGVVAESEVAGDFPVEVAGMSERAGRSEGSRAKSSSGWSSFSPSMTG
jgi:hypothetical protein